MKKFIISLLLTAIAHTAMAQTTLVATLIDYNGNYVNTYYGANALVEAYNDADHGYTIVLSPGQFNSAFTLSKLITIRGAGMCSVPEKNVQPTILNGTITFGTSWDLMANFPDSKITMEGICTRDEVNFANDTGLKNAQFTKCVFGKFFKVGTNLYRWENVSFVDCYMLGQTYLPNSSTVAFYNCVLKDMWCASAGSTVHVENCVIYNGSNGATGNAVNKGLARNSFFIQNPNYPDSRFPPKAFVCDHCYSTTPNFFSNQESTTNTVVNRDITAIFKYFDGTDWKDTYDYYELTDWAKSNMTCGDGSQMSIYGGTAAPFSPLTSAPQITRFSAPESTSNGILHVNIEVEMPQ